MGVKLGPLVPKEPLTLEALRGRAFAVDAANTLHQFLALIRTPDGVPLKDSQGRVTSHLVGLLYRTTRLVTDYNLRLVFVFDGPPPDLKAPELERRRAEREKAEREYREALARGDMKTAWSKAVGTGRLTPQMADEAKRVLGFLGIPYVQAPGEGEAQAAFMAQRGDVWAAASRDFDSLLFGAPRLLRYLTITGRRRLPGQRGTVPLQPELIRLDCLLAEHGLTREQLVDVAILIGTDFSPGVPQVGPKTALKLISEHGSLENLPSDIKEKLPDIYPQVRELFLNPPVTEDYDLSPRPVDREGLLSFLCGERGFSEDRVLGVIERMQRARQRRRTAQQSLDTWVSR